MAKPTRRNRSPTVRRAEMSLRPPFHDLDKLIEKLEKRFS